MRAPLLLALILSLIFSARAAARASDYDRVILISIDGLHAQDVVDPTLARRLPWLHHLEATGLRFARARTTAPSDSLPGTLAYLTGAGPATTGIAYDDTFDRNLTPPGGNAHTPRGAEVALTEALDRDSSRLDGGADAGAAALDPKALPLRCSALACARVSPHAFLRVNTIYDVASTHGLHTLLLEKHPAYAVAFAAHDAPLVNFYAPEIDARVALEGGRLVDRRTAHGAASLGSVGAHEATAEAYDELKVQALLRALDNPRATPAIAVMNLQTVNFAEKSPEGGIAADGVVSARLQRALRYAPACALIAIIVPDLMTSNGALALSTHNIRLIAALISVPVFLATRNMLTTIVVGMLALTALRLAF